MHDVHVHVHVHRAHVDLSLHVHVVCIKNYTHKLQTGKKCSKFDANTNTNTCRMSLIANS